MSKYNCPKNGCGFESDSTAGMSRHTYYHDEDIEFPSKEMYLSSIRELKDELGEVPTFRDMNNYGEFSATLYHHKFGSWSNAVEMAGFETRKTPSGEDSPQWNGGNTKFYKSEAGEAWRKAVFERDNYTCQDCGDDTGGNLNAHHIKRRSEYPEYELMVWNGVTLCEICHCERHKREEVYEMMKTKALNRNSPNSES